MNLQNILYTPISTSPYPNDFNVDDLRDWAASVYPQWEKKPLLIPKEDGTMIDLKKPHYVNPMQNHYGERYAWDVTRGANNGKFLDGFKERFPSLVNWLMQTFDFEEDDLQGILLISMRPNPVKEQWHEDHDLFGYRFYLDLPDGDDNPLILQPLKQKFEDKTSLYRHLLKKMDIDKDLEKYEYSEYFRNLIAQDKIIKAPYPPGLSAYYLNNCSALHTVQWNKPHPKRLTGFVELKERKPGLKEKHIELIKRSVEKYKPYIVEWSPE